MLGKEPLYPFGGSQWWC